MSSFDSIIDETRERFNLGDKAEVLLSVLLALMTDKMQGGFAGFLERFDHAGLGSLTSSWINSGANTSISNEQLESALGSETLQNISNQTGLDYETTSSATAFMTPLVVDNLTPDGVLPEENDLVSRTGTYLTGAAATISGVSAANTFDRIGTATTDTVDSDRVIVSDRIGIADTPQTIGNRVDTNLSSVDNFEDTDNSPMRWLLPLIILGLLVILGFWFCGV